MLYQHYSKSVMQCYLLSLTVKFQPTKKHTPRTSLIGFVKAGGCSQCSELMLCPGYSSQFRLWSHITSEKKHCVPDVAIQLCTVQTSTSKTVKSSCVARGSLWKVGQGKLAPWYKSASNQRAKLPLKQNKKNIQVKN